MKQLKHIIFAVLALFSIAFAAPPTSFAVSADEQEFSSIELQQETIVNELVQQGYLQVDEATQEACLTDKYIETVFRTVDTSVYQVIFSDHSVSIIPRFQDKSFTGVNKIVYTWKGFDVYLDSTNVNKLAADLEIGGVAAMLTPDPSLSKVLRLSAYVHWRLTR